LRDEDPELEVMMDPDPKLDLKLIKNHQKNLQLDNYDIKNTGTLIKHFLRKVVPGYT
jgi:hypothetical protein